MATVSACCVLNFLVDNSPAPQLGGDLRAGGHQASHVRDHATILSSPPLAVSSVSGGLSTFVIFAVRSFSAICAIDRSTT
jgi:hypothetical protein